MEGEDDFRLFQEVKKLLRLVNDRSGSGLPVSDGKDPERFLSFLVVCFKRSTPSAAKGERERLSRRLPCWEPDRVGDDRLWEVFERMDPLPTSSSPGSSVFARWRVTPRGKHIEMPRLI